MRAFTGVISIILLAHAFAAKADCANPSFFPVAELAKTLPTQAASVSISILLSTGRWEDCSGAVVSDDGDILTASHCLDHCVAEKNNSKASPYDISGTLGYGSVDQKRATSCLFKINGFETKADVELNSVCDFDQHQYAASSSQPSRCSAASDIAVIKPEIKIPVKACLQFAKKFSVGESVYSIGRPESSHREKGNADGVSTYASFGKIIPHSAQCTVLQAFKSANLNADHLGTKKNLIISRGQMDSSIQTSVDALPGSSGGPLINRQGQVIAVASFVDPYANDEYTQCEGATFFAPVFGVNANTSVFAPNFDLSNLRCENHRIKTNKLLH